MDQLRAVQRQREWPVKVVQFIQSQLQKRVIENVLRSQGQPRVPAIVALLFKIPLLRDLPARVMAFGVRHVRLEESKGGA